MPYDIKKKGKKYFVENKLTGSVKGSHDTKEDAKKQLAALYANEPKYKAKMYAHIEK